MPFVDDAGIIRENHRGPIIDALAVFGEQVERMIAVSVAWAATLFPALVAAAFPQIPGVVRIGLVATTCVSGAVATAALYAVARHALSGDQVCVADAKAAVREQCLPGLRVLAPLAALPILLASAAIVAATHGLTAVQVGLQAGLGVLVVCGVYWGPLTVSVPDATALGVLRGSVHIAWRNPGASVKIAAATALLALLGVVTVAGAVLAVPAAVALVQMNALDGEIR